MNKDPKNNSDGQADPFGFLSGNEESSPEQDGVKAEIEKDNVVEDPRDKDDGVGEKEKTIEEINPFKSLSNLTLYAIANSEKYRNLMGMTMGDEGAEKKSDLYVQLAKEEIGRRKEAGEFYPEKDVDLRADFDEKFYVSNGNPKILNVREWETRDATYEEVMEARKGNRSNFYRVDVSAGDICLRDENGKLTRLSVEEAFYKALVSKENIDHADEMVENSFFDKDFKDRLKSVVDYVRESGIDDKKISRYGYAKGLHEGADERQYIRCKEQIQKNPDDAERIIDEAKIDNRWKNELREDVLKARVQETEARVRENPDDAEKIIDEAKIDNRWKWQLKWNALKTRVRENPDDAEKIIDEAKVADWHKDDLRSKINDLRNLRYSDLYDKGDKKECERLEKKFGIVDGALSDCLARDVGFYVGEDGELMFKYPSHYFIPGKALLEKAKEELAREKKEFVGILGTLSPEEQERIAGEMVVGNRALRKHYQKRWESSYNDESGDALKCVMAQIKGGRLTADYNVAVQGVLDRMVDRRVLEYLYRKDKKSLEGFFRSEVFKDKDDAFFVEKGMDWLRNSLMDALASGAIRDKDEERPHFVFETEEFEKYKDEIGIDFDDPKIFDLCFEGWKNTIEEQNGQFSDAQKWYFQEVFSRDFGKFMEYTETLRNVTYDGQRGNKSKLTQALKELGKTDAYINAQQKYLEENESEKGRLMMKGGDYKDMVRLMNEYEAAHKEGINMFRTRSIYRGERARDGEEKVEDKKLPHYGFFKAKEMMNLLEYVKMNFDWPGKDTETEEEQKKNPHAPHLYYQQFGNEKGKIEKEITLDNFLDEPSFFIGFTFEYNGQPCAIFDNLGCRKGGGRFVMRDKTGDGVDGLLANFENSREEVRKRGEIEGDAIRLNHMADVNGYQIMEPLRDLNVRTLYWLKYDRKYDGGYAKQKYGTSYPTLEDAVNRNGEILQNEEYGDSFDDLRSGESVQEYADRAEEMARRAEELSNEERQQMLEDTFI